MAAIPKREGQGINGRGVSIAALVAMLVLLPVMASSVITIGKRFGGDYEHSIAGPTLHPQQNPAVFPTYMDARYDYDSHIGAAVLDFASGSGMGALEWSGAGVGGTLTAFAGEKYIPLGSCLNTSAPPGASCGDDEYRVALNDFPGDMVNALGQPYSRMPLDEIPWRVEFEAVDFNNVWGCADTRFGQSSVDYKVHLFTYSLITLDEWTDLLGGGTMDFNNYLETNITAGGFDNPCYARLFMYHDLDVAAINTFSDRMEWASTNTEPSCQGCPPWAPNEANDWRIEISFDNLTDRERGIPMSVSSQPNVFEASGEGNNLHVRLKFHLVSIDGINTASRLATVAVGGIFWVAAVASTPAWNPLKDRMKKGMAESGRRGVD